MTQSGIKRKDGTVEVRETDDGIYVIENAYSGAFEYFDGRPIDVDVKLGNHEEGSIARDSNVVQVNIL